MIRLLRDKLKPVYHRFLHDPDFRELVRSSAGSLFMRLIGVSTGFLVTLVTARYYSAGALGIVSICVGLLSIASAFAKLGHDVALMRDVSAYFSTRNFPAMAGIYRTSLRQIIPVSLVISVILWWSAPWMAVHLFHKPFLEDVLRMNAYLVFPLTLLQVHAEILRGIKRVMAYTFFQTAAVSTFALVFLLLFSRGTGEVHIPYYIQFACIMSAGLMSTFYWMRKSGFFQTTPFYDESSRNLRRTSAPMFTTTLLQLLMSWLGTLVLAAYATEAEVGVYNALIRISVFSNIMILAINGLMMTRFASAHHQGDHAALRSHAQESLRLIFWTSLPLFIGLFVFAEPLLQLFGPPFAEFRTELYVLLAGQLIVACVGLPGQLLNMTGKQKDLRSIAWVSAAVHAILCWLMIPRLGMMGACWAQVAGTLIWNLACVWVVYRRTGVFSVIGLG